MARICRGLLPEQMHEEVGEPGRLAKVEHDDVRRLLVFGGANRARSTCSGRRTELSALVSLGHATCLPRRSMAHRRRVRRQTMPSKVRAAQCVAAPPAAPGPQSIPRSRSRRGSQWLTHRPSAHRSKISTASSRRARALGRAQSSAARARQPRRACSRDRKTRPRDDGEVRAIENRREVLPAFDLRERVGADDEEQLRCREPTRRGSAGACRS